MLYVSRMRWKLDGMSFDALWKFEGQEAKAAVESIQQGIVSHLYKPCAEQYVISIGGRERSRISTATRWASCRCVNT